MTQNVEPILKVENYNVEFWVDGVWYPAAIDMNYHVMPGEVLAIVGESGSGKSSSSMGLMGLLASNARTTGKVMVKGVDMLTANSKTLRSYRGKEVAYIFQEPMTALNPVYTIGFQIIETLKTHFDITTAAARTRAIELLTLVEIPNPEKSIDKYPHQLSGGMRQRLALARALSVEPRIILMDEPFAAVDALTRERLQEELLHLWQETKKTIVLVTHDVDEAVYLSDEVVVFSPLPGSIRNKVTVDIPRPRRRTSSELRQIKERLLAMYRYDTVHESDYSI